MNSLLVYQLGNLLIQVYIMYITHLYYVAVLTSVNVKLRLTRREVKRILRLGWSPFLAFVSRGKNSFALRNDVAKS